MSPFWITAIALLVFVGISDLFTSVYLHRGKTHRSVRFHPVPENAMRLWLWLLIGQVVKNWVAVHRKHHKFPDKLGDPHSPYLLGFWTVWFLNVVLYAKALAEDSEIIQRYAPDIPSNKILDNYWLGYGSGLILFAIGFGLWLGFSWWTPLFAFLAYSTHLLIYFMTLSVVNGVCHKFGYQNFHEKDNRATNFPWFFFLIAGEVWHNNHHHDPFSPKIGYRWWEIDLGWILIKTLIFFGLAWQDYMTINEKEAAAASESPH